MEFGAHVGVIGVDMEFEWSSNGVQMEFKRSLNGV